MPQRVPSESDRTPLDEALVLVGDRWSLLLVEELLGGPRRFNDLVERMPGIASNVLSQRLKNLERHGLLVAVPYSRRPVRHSYQLTGPGRELVDALRLLAAWGARASENAEQPRHRTCGTPLETRWYCPTCVEAVPDAEGSDIRYF
jgi:DNA-binding HxlR family transcriptional regulator